MKCYTAYKKNAYTLTIFKEITKQNMKAGS